MDRLVPGFVIAFAAGVALHRVLPPGGFPAAFGLVAAAAFAAGRPGSVRPLLPPPFAARLPPLLLALAAACGAARSAADLLPPPPGSLDRLLPPGPLPVVLEGIVTEAPDPPRAPGSGGDREAVATFALEADSLRAGSRSVAAGGRVFVRVEGAAPDLLPGDRAEATGLARRPGSFRNPGVAIRDGRETARVLEAPGAGAVHRLGAGCPLRPARIAARLRRGALGAIRRASPGPGGALLEALVVGEAEGLDEGMVRDFRRAGVWHVLVVSGLHAGLAAAAAAFLLARAGAGPGSRSAGAVLAAAAVAGASGFGQPALRAVIALSLAAAAPLLRRRTAAVHARLSAAGVFLALHPASLFEPGFQLSFAAVLGILRLSPALGRLLFGKRRFLRRFPVPAASRSLLRRPVDLLERFLPPSLAAWLATTPILAHHFGSFSPVAPLANLVVVPAASLLLAASPAILVAGAFLPGTTAPLLDGIASLLAGTVHGAARLPGAWLPVAPPALLLLLLGGTLAAAALRPTGRRLLLVAASTALLAALPPAAAPDDAAPSVLVMDVGHGAAVLADSGEARVLLDAGGRGARVAEAAVLPARRARGALSLDGLFLSHEDADHYSAAVEILESLPVGVVVVNDEFGITGRGRAVFEAAARAGVPVVRAAAGDVFRWKGLAVRVLHPPAGGWRSPSDNDGSLVLRVEMEGLSALLTGDLEDAGLRRLLLSGADLRADLLLLPHHGSPGTEGVDALAAATGARILAASAGPSSPVRGPVGSPACPRFVVTAEEGGVEVRGR